jgi:hypothetical protein
LEVIEVQYSGLKARLLSLFYFRFLNSAVTGVISAHILIVAPGERATIGTYQSTPRAWATKEKGSEEVREGTREGGRECLLISNTKEVKTSISL